MLTRSEDDSNLMIWQKKRNSEFDVKLISTYLASCRPTKNKVCFEGSADIHLEVIASSEDCKDCQLSYTED